MITVMLDNDISGYRDHFAGTLRDLTWEELNLVEFMTMKEVGLDPETKDREVWQFCQDNGFILLTANRNKDDDTSLEQTLRDENVETSLPVLTVSDKQRIPESGYRERCIDAIVTVVFDLELFLGTGRRYIP